MQEQEEFLFTVNGEYYSMSRLKEEPTEEQFERFLDEYERNGLEEAITVLPELAECNGMSFLNERIKSLRVENNLTQSEVANALGISQREYWRYEQEGYSPRVTSIAMLAMFYNVSLDWISGFSDLKAPFGDGKERVINGYSLRKMKKAKAEGKTYSPSIYEKA